MEAETFTQRYDPPMKKILERLVSGSLSAEDFPAEGEMPDYAAGGAAVAHSARKRGGGKKGRATSKWQQSSADEAADEASFKGGRVIVFMIGGMSYAELRVAREVMAKQSREVVVGSTIFTKPEDFIEDVKRL